MLISSCNWQLILSLSLWFGGSLGCVLLWCWLCGLLLWLWCLRYGGFVRVRRRAWWLPWPWVLWGLALVSFVYFWDIWHGIFLDLNPLCIRLRTLILVETSRFRFSLTGIQLDLWILIVWSEVLFSRRALILPRQTSRTLLVALLVLFLWIISLTFWGLCTSVFLLFLFYDIGEGPLLVLLFASFYRLRSPHLVDPWYGRLVRYPWWWLLVLLILHIVLIDNLDIVAWIIAIHATFGGCLSELRQLLIFLTLYHGNLILFDILQFFLFLFHD